MTDGSTDEKQQAHELIERLPPKQLSALVGLLEAMLDPASLPAAEEEKALGQAREWSKRKSIPHEQVLADLGITQEEIDHVKFEGPK